jgi:enterochelin esterase-like enzyme
MCARRICPRRVKLARVPGEPAAAEGASADDGTMTFRVADPDQVLAGVRLQQDAGIPADRLDFRRAGDHWELQLERPPVDRLEYLLELRYPGGSSKVVTDPANPRQVGGAFGRKSVLEFAGYAEPGWLHVPADPGTATIFEVPAPALNCTVAVRIWSAAGCPDDEPLPLLVVHDGPEYDALAGLTRYLGAGVAGGSLPRLRAALLSPGQRNNWYSANSRYARALADRVIPMVTQTVASTVRIGMGASLGALAMLHAHCRHPGIADGLFLQSGSFFVPALDSQERGFPYYRRITAFTAALQVGGVPDVPVPVAMTCGEIEENAANNRLMLARLRSAGYPASLHEVADVHNYTAWRDAFDPWLTELVRLVTR